MGFSPQNGIVADCLNPELCGNQGSCPDSPSIAHNSDRVSRVELLKFSRNRHIRNLVPPENSSPLISDELVIRHDRVLLRAKRREPFIFVII